MGGGGLYKGYIQHLHAIDYFESEFTCKVRAVMTSAFLEVEKVLVGSCQAERVGG